MRKKKPGISIFSLLLLLSVAAGIFLIQRLGGTIAGSNSDWISQHTAIADYFRTRFYETHSLFPQFASNLGAGQNIYYFAYYGLYNPLYMLSWLFPSCSMETWFQIIGVLTHAADGILCMMWLRGHCREGASLAGALMLMLSASVVCQTTAQVMFVNYMPYLLMMLLGADRREKKSGVILLASGTFFMILTSFYYSVAGIAVLLLYVAAKSDAGGFRAWIRGIFHQLLPALIGVLLAGFYLLPVLFAILSGRSGGKSTDLSVADLLIPDFTISKFLYDAYGLGLTSMALVVVGVFLFSSGMKERRLAALLAIVCVFPVFSWIFNGGLYARSKSLIPFLPLFSMLFACFLERAAKKKLLKKAVIGGTAAVSLLILIFAAKKYTGIQLMIVGLDLMLSVLAVALAMFRKTACSAAITILAMGMMCTLTLYAKSGSRVTTAFEDELHDTKVVRAVEKAVSGDDTPVRTEVRGTRQYQNANQNRILTANQNLTTCYSSLENPWYTKFRDEIGLSRACRNLYMLDSQNNPLFLRFMGVRYLIGSDQTDGSQTDESESANVYAEEKAAPIFYLTDQTMSEEQFSGLSWQKKQLAMLEYAAVPDGDTVREDALQYTDIHFQSRHSVGVDLEQKGSAVEVKANKRGRTEIKLSKSVKKGTAVFISFRVKNNSETKDVSITINGVKNKLSKKNYVYYNGNEYFHYTIVMPEDGDSLSVVFSSGNYSLNEISCHVGFVDEEKNSTLYQQKADLKLASDGDGYSGEITTSEEKWLITSIPYDTGFTVYVDGKKVSCQKVNDAFLGLKISAGTHTVEIRYRAGGARAGAAVSILTIVCIVAGKFIRKRRRKQKHPGGFSR